MHTINCSNFSATDVPGVYTISYQLAQQQTLSVYLPLQSTSVGGAVVDVGPYVDFGLYDGTLVLPSTAEAGQPVTLRLSSNTSHLAVTNTGTDGWLVTVTTPGNITLQLGLMQPALDAANASIWTFTVPGGQMSQVSC